MTSDHVGGILAGTGLGLLIACYLTDRELLVGFLHEIMFVGFALLAVGVAITFFGGRNKGN